MIKRQKPPPRPSVADKEVLETETEIIAWLKYQNVQTYTIRKTEEGFVVDVAQTVRLLHKTRVLPFSFGMIHGNFNCSGIGLETLQNSPRIVSGIFDCRDNRLTTLVGGPREVLSLICDSFRL